MIISFAWTTPALLAGEKTVTRREWSDDYAAKFHKGDIVDAYNRQARFGGKLIGRIKLLETPYKEWSNLIPEEDYEKEGFLYLERKNIKCGKLRPFDIWRQWLDEPEVFYVVRFKVVAIHSIKENRIVELI